MCFHSRDIETVKKAIAHLDAIIFSSFYSISPAAVAIDKPISTSILDCGEASGVHRWSGCGSSQWHIQDSMSQAIWAFYDLLCFIKKSEHSGRHVKLNKNGQASTISNI